MKIQTDPRSMRKFSGQKPDFAQIARTKHVQVHFSFSYAPGNQQLEIEFALILVAENLDA
jgi:hypothetical protein